MENIRINRLPSLTYRYLHTNDTPVAFGRTGQGASVVFSDPSLVTEGGEFPETWKGASEETVREAVKGGVRTLTVPAGQKTSCRISVTTDKEHPDFAGAFVVRLEEGASLSLIWEWDGPDQEGTLTQAVFYDLAPSASLHVSLLDKHLEGALLIDQRFVRLAEKAKAEFASAKLGGTRSAVHSYGRLEGKKSEMKEYAVYTAAGKQHLDLFYHIDHLGEETRSHIDAKGSLAGESSKVFRGTIDFKRGCSGAEGDEGDYAIQLDPKTHNVSLPLLLCTEDNVVGNHASSAGQLDANTLYYLMTRGFSLEEARLMVVESMIRPLVDKMDESLREEVGQAIRDKLMRNFSDKIQNTK
jgi:Fe-S cluster assembly protein SufD